MTIWLDLILANYRRILTFFHNHFCGFLREESVRCIKNFLLMRTVWDIFKDGTSF